PVEGDAPRLIDGPQVFGPCPIGGSPRWGRHRSRGSSAGCGHAMVEYRTAYRMSNDVKSRSPKGEQMVSPQPAPVANLNLGQLNVSNHLLGNRAALTQAWARDGYWYFKDALDREVIARMRAVWIDYLQRAGLIDPGVNENRYNGSESRLTADSLGQISEFNQRNLHTLLTESPAINATMRQILGEEPF